MLVVIAILGLSVLLDKMTYTFSDGTQKTGFNAILGKSVDIGSESYEGYKDVTEFSDVISEARPKIEYRADACIKNEVSEPLLDDFDIIYSDGTRLRVSNNACEILDILDHDGNSVISSLDMSQKLMKFTSEGIYTVKLYVCDSQNRDTTVKIKIPVGR